MKLACLVQLKYYSFTVPDLQSISSMIWGEICQKIMLWMTKNSASDQNFEVNR